MSMSQSDTLRQEGSERVSFRGMLAGDVVQLALQPSQHVFLGVHRPVHSIEEGREMVAMGPAWTAVGSDGRILCCAGFGELFAPGPATGGHAVAWALLAAGLGPAHLAITRFARRQFAESPYSRIEAIVQAGPDHEKEGAWARRVGMKFAAWLPKWGPEGKLHVLYERIK